MKINQTIDVKDVNAGIKVLTDKIESDIKHKNTTEEQKTVYLWVLDELEDIFDFNV